MQRYKSQHSWSTAKSSPTSSYEGLQKSSSLFEIGLQKTNTSQVELSPIRRPRIVKKENVVLSAKMRDRVLEYGSGDLGNLERRPSATVISTTKSFNLAKDGSYENPYCEIED